jgi:hypothetical protein
MNNWTANDWKTFFEGVALVVTACLSGLAAVRSGIAIKKADKTHDMLDEHEGNAEARHKALASALQEK